jgi:hypothetical protein
MTYVKPELVLLNNALEAIQGNPPGSKLGITSDHRAEVTVAAYEADE